MTNSPTPLSRGAKTISPRRRRVQALLALLATLASTLTFLGATQQPAHAAIGFPATADLNGRAGKSLTARVVEENMYLKGQTVNVVCQDRGDQAYGSDIWDRTTDGVWVPDYYVKTGYSGYHPSLPRCGDSGQTGRAFLAGETLNGRNAPSLSARVVQEDMYPKGQTVTVVCQTTGGSAYGSTIWDKTDEGVYVPDAYVKTGYTGFHPDLARCGGNPGSQGFLAKTDLAGRDAKRITATEVKTYPGGTMVDIVCQAIGENAYGSNIWDKTTDGLWVADHYVKTGYDTFHPDLPRCAGEDDTGSSGGGYPAKTDLAGRDAKRISATEVKTYPAGSSVKIVCQAYGSYAYGSYIWDKTTDGLWVADYYVQTGTDGFVSGMPRCDNDQPSGEDGGPPPASGDCSVGHGRINGPAGPATGTNQEKINRVIAAARAMTGKGLSYSWGGGGRGGPACGSGALSPGGYNDYNVLGFDCSGLTLYAFWKGAGIDIGGYTGAQYRSGYGRAVSYSQRQPGDLIFWGTSTSSTTHVAIYIGNDQMIEAAPPRGTGSVHITTVYGGNRLPNVIRYFG